jgi:4-diphosphocytidyl-2-C-methyl-D-erythritol kinase
MTAADGPATEAFAPAKINLTLHVTGRRADGYHLLDSLVVFAALGDRIRLRPADRPRLKVTGPMAAGVPEDGRNLALRAARLAGAEGLEITLEKHLPAAAGIGGGSSDAAAVLRALGAAERIPLADLMALGADLPVCMAARSARMRGAGESVAPVSGIPPLPAVLVNPGVALSTGAVFGALSSRFGAAMPEIPGFADLRDCAAWLRDRRNDLQVPACALEPSIGLCLDALQEAGALLARMSGSGATCFGLFAAPEDAERAAAAIGAAHPGWWVRATLLAGEGS